MKDINVECSVCHAIAGYIVHPNTNRLGFERHTGWTFDPSDRDKLTCPDCRFAAGEPVHVSQIHDDTILDMLDACQNPGDDPCGKCDGCITWLGDRRIII